MFLLFVSAPQTPEAERPMELALQATGLALAPSGRMMAVSCQDGSVSLHTLPDMAMQVGAH